MVTDRTGRWTATPVPGTRGRPVASSTVIAGIGGAPSRVCRSTPSASDAFHLAEPYERMRCDPAMMAELGGPLPSQGIPGKVARDVGDAESDRAWIVIVEADGTPVGHVCIWDHDEDGEHINEIGWMVLPEFQGQGLGRDAALAILDKARRERRWGVVHTFPGATNAPSNAICRALGFTGGST
ncbi:MAG: GNAT family N-acetyltransferase [Actinomycetota bacterium]